MIKIKVDFVITIRVIFFVMKILVKFKVLIWLMI